MFLGFHQCHTPFKKMIIFYLVLFFTSFCCSCLFVCLFVFIYSYVYISVLSQGSNHLCHQKPSCCHGHLKKQYTILPHISSQFDVINHIIFSSSPFLSKHSNWLKTTAGHRDGQLRYRGVKRRHPSSTLPSYAIFTSHKIPSSSL